MTEDVALSHPGDKPPVHSTQASIRKCRISLLQSRASWPLVVTSASILGIGIAIQASPLRGYFGFTSLGALYWPLLALALLSYIGSTQTGQGLAVAEKVDLIE